MVQATLYLLHYNNYYNRQVKKESSLSGYMQYVIGTPITSVNFIPNDFVDTKQVVNWEYDDPDYLVVVDESGNINSRWFVVFASRVRAGQLELTLHRDLVVDYYDSIVESPCFIEKATLNSDNPLIFNPEDMSFNQIKTSETLLKDTFGCPWVVVYAASQDSNAGGNQTVSKEYTVTNISDNAIPISRTFDSVSAWNEFTNKYSIGESSDPVYKSDIETVRIRNCYVGSTTSSRFTYMLKNSRNDSYITTGSATSGTYPQVKQQYTALEVWDMLGQSTFDEVSEQYKAQQTASGVKTISQSDYDDIYGFNNTIVRVNQGNNTYKYYRINTSTYTKSDDFVFSSGTMYSNMMQKLGAYVQTGSVFNPGWKTFGGGFYYYDGYSSNNWNEALGYLQEYHKLTVGAIGTPELGGVNYFIHVTAQDITSSVSAQIGEVTIQASRYHLIDAPYDMFCMPLSDDLKITNSLVSGFGTITSNKQIALNFARRFSEKYGETFMYDSQILPYCPFTNAVMNESTNTMDLRCDSKGYTFITEGSSNIGIVLHCTVSSFSREITLPEPIVVTEPKVQALCDTYRICSPNYSGAFEFNAAMNNGCDSIKIQCTYKPYDPYIKVYPSFKYMYGNDYNDSRGLICGGDFSLPKTTSAWETYQLNNKTYQDVFNRQIQNMVTVNDIARKQERWQVGAGALSALISGATGGAMAGGIAGGIAGGLIGGVSSFIGGMQDIKYNEQLRQENMSLARDMYGFNLQNIKALPMTLSKTTAYNIDNKYFPFLEYYTCTDIEKQALRDKIKYNGMTVMTIGTMNNYIIQGTPTFIKGKLIRIEGINEDYHILNAISDEVYAGVYI